MVSCEAIWWTVRAEGLVGGGGRGCRWSPLACCSGSCARGRGGAPVAQALRSLGDGLVGLVPPLLAALVLLAEALTGYMLAILALRVALRGDPPQ